jgi:ABC-type sulfate transport system permease component
MIWRAARSASIESGTFAFMRCLRELGILGTLPSRLLGKQEVLPVQRWIAGWGGQGAAPPSQTNGRAS